MCEEHLQPGDRIVLYTDGSTEARRSGDREFGLARFTDFLTVLLCEWIGPHLEPADTAAGLVGLAPTGPRDDGGHAGDPL